MSDDVALKLKATATPASDCTERLHAMYQHFTHWRARAEKAEASLKESEAKVALLSSQLAEARKAVTGGYK